MPEPFVSVNHITMPSKQAVRSSSTSSYFLDHNSALHYLQSVLYMDGQSNNHIYHTEFGPVFVQFGPIGIHPLCNGYLLPIAYSKVN